MIPGWPYSVVAALEPAEIRKWILGEIAAAAAKTDSFLGER